MTEMTRTAVNTHKMVLAAIFAAIMAFYILIEYKKGKAVNHEEII